MKRTLGASSSKRSRSRKLPPADPTEVVAENMQPSQPVPPPTPAAAPPLVVPQPAQKRLAKPYSYPSIMALPSKVAIPLNEHGRSFLEFTFLPVSDLKGPKKGNAFITFCNHSENHAVLVSRAFPSTSITLQGEYLAIRQVHFIAATTSSTSTEYSMYKHCPLSLYTLGQLGIFFRS